MKTYVLEEFSQIPKFVDGILIGFPNDIFSSS